mgnify:CR=1 FL=1
MYIGVDQNTHRQTGESIDTREGRQEVEPFGQSIRTTPPLEEEPPANPVPIIGDSLFPEWQCALPTDLIPTHCALKMIADIKGGGLWLGPTSTKNKEGNIGGMTFDWAKYSLKNTVILYDEHSSGRNTALTLTAKRTSIDSTSEGTVDCPRGTTPVMVGGKEECVGPGESFVTVQSEGSGTGYVSSVVGNGYGKWVDINPRFLADDSGPWVGPLTGPLFEPRKSPSVPCGAQGISTSAFGGIAWGGSEIAGTIGTVTAQDLNNTQTTFVVPFTGYVIGGSAQAGSGFPGKRGWGFGAALSAGPSYFWSPNQSKPAEQIGEFDTTIIATPFITVGIDKSPDGTLTNYTLGGPSVGAGIFNFRTNTKPPYEANTALPGCLNTPFRRL